MDAFQEIVFADDLNACRKYDATVQTERILSDMGACQRDFHKWGRANQVTFDPSKESTHILSRGNPSGEPFDLLGVRFHCKLPTHFDRSGEGAGRYTMAASDFFGGSGGDECRLGCAGGSGGWRRGGLVESVVIASGERVDRIELSKCTEDLAV